MIEISLCFPQSIEVGTNVLTVTAKDLSFATTAIVKLDKSNDGNLIFTSVAYANTVGAIPNPKKLNEDLFSYLKSNNNQLVS